MKKFLILLLVLALCGCAAPAAPSTEPATAPTMPMTTVPETTIPETTVPETTVPVTTAPPHSEFYLEDFPVEEIITYFNEVVLQVEYTDGTGDPSRVQKWLQPIICSIHGEPTMEDQQVLEQFFAELNQMPGFPGIRLAQPGEYANMTLSFLDADAFVSEFSEAVNGEDAWGACQFWYWTDTNELYDARIGYRTDIPSGGDRQQHRHHRHPPPQRQHRLPGFQREPPAQRRGLADPEAAVPSRYPMRHGCPAV